MTRHLALLLLAGGLLPACVATTPPRETTSTPPKPAPVTTRLVNAGSLASRHGMTYHSDARRHRVVLEDGADRIVLYPGTTVAVVNGHKVEGMEKIHSRRGTVLLDAGDARELERLLETTALTREPAAPRPVEHRPLSATAHRAVAPTGEAAWRVPLKVRWLYVVLHHSGTASGCASAFHKHHRDRRGWDGLGYHFVIGNGKGSDDGEVEVGYRWTKQITGAHAGKASDGTNLMNERGIGICLVGDFNKKRPSAAQRAALGRLLFFLTNYCRIPPERVVGHRDLKQTDCPGRNFPYAEFLQDRRLVPTAYRRN